MKTDRPRARKEIITSIRLDDESVGQINEILEENPLYTRPHVMRAAIMALYQLDPLEREQIIIATAAR